MQKALAAEAASSRREERSHVHDSRTEADRNGDLTRDDVEQFLYREARYSTTASSGQLAASATRRTAEFWMPAWDDDDTLVTDPQREISLIYYGNRGGLEDRVFRIKTDRSSATSLPEPRTSHNITNVEIVEPGRRRRSRCGSTGSRCTTATRPSTPISARRSTRSTSPGRQPLIKKKKVVLKNDYIHHVVDIYHI